MRRENLNSILKKHLLWLENKNGGERAILRNKDLSKIDLSGVDLSGADLDNVNLSGATLIGINLSAASLVGANLSCANMYKANLKGTILKRAYMSAANLCEVDLSDAVLKRANLSSVDLTGAILRYTNFTDAILSKAKLVNVNMMGTLFVDVDMRYTTIENIFYDEKTSFFALQCPEEGSFIGYKKCIDDLIVKLEILKESKRSSGTTRGCRASKVKVVNITDIGTTKDFKEAKSIYDSSFVYKQGDIIEIEDFDDNRWNNSSTGIHFFITRQEAVNY